MSPTDVALNMSMTWPLDDEKVALRPSPTPIISGGVVPVAPRASVSEAVTTATVFVGSVRWAEKSPDAFVVEVVEDVVPLTA